MQYICYTLIVIGLLIQSVHARPVSYPDGWTLMVMNDGNKNAVHLHYSPTAYTSLGYRLEYGRDKEFTLHAIQMNNLLKRWNSKESQANLYLKSGAGIVYGDNHADGSKVGAAGFTGIAADWENRRFFTSYENRYLQAGNIDDFYVQSARVGIAPYIGNYGDLHTWLMLQIEHQPESARNITVTPLVRLFKGVHLVEAGMSHHGEVLFNYVLRY